MLRHHRLLLLLFGQRLKVVDVDFAVDIDAMVVVLVVLAPRDTM